MEFKNFKLEEICTVVTDGSHFSPKASSSGFPMLSVKDMREFDFNYEKVKMISEEDYNQLVKSGCQPLPNDVLIAKDGNTSLKYCFVFREKKEVVLLSSIAILRPNVNIVNPYYLMYYLSLRSTKDELKQGYLSGSAIPRVVLKDFKRYSLKLPSLKSQNSIVDLIKAINSKIEINSGIIKNLEQLSQALFKHWFVDYEFPNENGEPYKSSGGEMVEFEGELVPENWKAFKLTDLVSSVSESINKKEKEMAIFLNTSDILDGKMLHKEYTPTKEMPGQAKKLIKKGDILYSEIRPKNKRYTYIDFDSENYVVSTKLMVLRTKENLFSSKVMYLFLTGEKVINELQAIAEFRSGTFPQITFKQLDHFKFMLPEKTDFKDNYKILEEMIECQFFINKENDYLKEMRDTLLPKLLSGEIELPDETEVNEHVSIS